MNTDRLALNMRNRFGSWWLLAIFVLIAVANSDLMGRNHEHVVGAESKFANVEQDLPDARYWLFNTGRLWTSDDIRAWVQSRSEWQLDEYRLHNRVAFQVFVILSGLLWCLCSLLLSPRLMKLQKWLFLVPALAMGVKIIEVACIHVMLETHADPAESYAPFLNLDAVALVGSLCTALKLWLILSWIPVFAVGIVLTVAEKLRRPAGAA